MLTSLKDHMLILNRTEHAQCSILAIPIKQSRSVDDSGVAWLQCTIKLLIILLITDHHGKPTNYIKSDLIYYKIWFMPFKLCSLQCC